MAEYISKDRVLCLIYATHSVGGFKTEEDYLWLQEAVVDAATSDVQPVKHGRWKLTNNPSFRKCSVCGAWWGSDITNNCFTNYCPKCGASMDKS